jgi:hypothetical protein
VNVTDGIDYSLAMFRITVINVNDPPVPIVTYYHGVYAYDGSPIDLTLRVAGTKYQSVTVTVYKDNQIVVEETITREPGVQKSRKYL